ncbi:hypothetical protein B484DRAFT_414296 [Ochromonadaceae sp. CCMP2298]|nr:hypothetical protein B484DRAFT_414296 [Ochromonadaceae sp. CCMP2298]
MHAGEPSPSPSPRGQQQQQQPAGCLVCTQPLDLQDAQVLQLHKCAHFLHRGCFLHWLGRRRALGDVDWSCPCSEHVTGYNSWVGGEWQAKPERPDWAQFLGDSSALAVAPFLSNKELFALGVHTLTLPGEESEDEEEDEDEDEEWEDWEDEEEEEA